MVHPVVTLCGELGILVVVVVVFLSWTLWGWPSICYCPLINALSAFHYVRGVWLVLLPGYMHSHMPSSEESGHWVPESLSQLHLGHWVPESLSQLHLGHWVFRITGSVTSMALSVQNHWVSYICGIDCSESLGQLHLWHWVFRITGSVTSVALSVQNHWVSCVCGIECSESPSQLHLWHWVFRVTESVVCVALSIQNHQVSCICGIEYSESLSQLCLWHWVFRVTGSFASVALSVKNHWVSCVCGCLQDTAGGLHQEGKQKWWIWRHSAQVQRFQPAGHQGVPLQQTDRCAVRL